MFLNPNSFRSFGNQAKIFLAIANSSLKVVNDKNLILDSTILAVHDTKRTKA
jgi:hypothetical protein